MNWRTRYINIYCEGELVRRVSIRKVQLPEMQEQYKRIMKEVTNASQRDGKIYYVELKVE